jgi:hypothetical protein
MAISLDSIKQPAKLAPRIVIHGGPGIGKSTLASQAPNPIFIDLEGGLGELPTQAFQPTSFDEVLESIGVLFTDDHQYMTLAIDSLDWLEALIWKKVVDNNKVEDISKIPYGQGYAEALGLWKKFFEGVTALRNVKGMMILMVCHSQILKIEEPLNPPYDSYALKLHKKASALVEEYSDCIFFANQKVITTSEDGKGFNQKRNRAMTTSERILHTSPNPAYTAKSRMVLPAEIPLSWAALSAELFPTTKKEAANG